MSIAAHLTELFGLAGQTAVVIGGAGVLGGALCEGLALAGAHVVVGDLTEEGCKARVASLQTAAARPAIAPSTSLAANRSRTCWPRPSSRPAAPTSSSTAPASTRAATSSTPPTPTGTACMTINLRAVFQACQVFGRHMVAAGGGAIVNIGSVTSHLPLSRVFAYSASKAAVLNLTRNIAQDFGPKGVRVNAICPGFFPAEQNRRLLDAERIDNIMRHTPMRRFGEPEELVGALLLLVSRKAGSFITGTHVNVDGGFTAFWF